MPDTGRPAHRSIEKVVEDDRIPEECKLTDLDDFASKNADLIVEVGWSLVCVRALSIRLLLPRSPTPSSPRTTEYDSYSTLTTWYGALLEVAAGFRAVCVCQTCE